MEPTTVSAAADGERNDVTDANGNRVLNNAAMRRSAISVWLFLSLTAAGAAAHEPTGTGHAVHVAVIKSLDLPEYNLARDGFIAKLGETGHKAVPAEYTLPRDEAARDSLWRTIDRTAPDLILALGTAAAREASRHEDKIPVIYSMVLVPPGNGADAPLPKQQDNLTGATLNIPLTTQLSEIARAFPTARRLGVISDPSRTRAAVDSVRHLAERRGLTIHVAWVDGEQDIPGAIRSLSDSIDVLWLIPDETVATPRSARFIIFELIKVGIPVVGLSSAYVKAGALLALDCDYADIGRQSGELAVQILAGQTPSVLARTVPRMLTRAVNLKVSEHMRIQIDEQVIKDSNVIVY